MAEWIFLPMILGALILIFFAVLFPNFTKMMILLSILLALLGFLLGTLMEQPGTLSLTWFGYHVETSPLVGVVGLIVVLLTAVAALSGLVRFIITHNKKIHK